MQTAWANWRLRPSLPASVQSSSRAGPRNRSIGGLLLQPRQPAVEDRHVVPGLRQPPLQQLLGRPELGEDDHLVGILVEQLQQPVDLGAVAELARPGPASCGELSPIGRGQLGVVGHVSQRAGRRLAGAAQRHLQRDRGPCARCRPLAARPTGDDAGRSA